MKELILEFDTCWAQEALELVGADWERQRFRGQWRCGLGVHVPRMLAAWIACRHVARRCFLVNLLSRRYWTGFLAWTGRASGALLSNVGSTTAKMDFFNLFCSANARAVIYTVCRRRASAARSLAATSLGSLQTTRRI